MDVKKLANNKVDGAVKAGTIDRRQRRALARLGLTSAGAYVAPTLLALHAATESSKPSSAKVYAA